MDAPLRIQFESGRGMVAAILRRPTAQEAAGVFSAARSGSLASLQNAVDPLVVGMEKLTGNEWGPMGLEGTNPAENRELFSLLLGCVPLAVQREVLSAAVARLAEAERIPDARTPRMA